MTITRTFQWYRTATSNPAASPATLSGATSASYTTVTADVNNYLHMKETATNAKGSATATSNVIGPITAAGQTYTPAAGTIAPLTGPVSGAPSIPRIIRDTEQAVYDAEIVSMSALHDLMHATTPQTIAVASGLWSSATTWSNGVPTAGVTAHIPTGFDVLYDVESSDQLKYIMVHGKLRWDVSKDTKLVCDTIHTGPGSYIEIGTRLSPVAESSTPGKARANIVFLGGAPGSSTRLGLMTMGKVSIRGAQKSPKVDLAVDPAAGATTLVAANGADVSGWRVGDTVCILSRDRVGFGADPQYTGPKQYAVREPNGNYNYASESGGFKQSHDEIRTITAITGQQITLSSALTYAHPTRATTHTLPVAPNPETVKYGFAQGQVVKLPPRVMNMSRSIRFESGGSPLSDRQKRAHIMFMACDQVDARWAEAKNMGRTDTDPTLYISEPKYGIDHFYNKDKNNQLFADNTLTVDLADPANVRGRYAWHLHGSGVFGQGATLARNMNVFQGLTAWAPQNEVPQPGWAITHHNSRLALHDCNVYNVRGAGIVSEIGTEIGQWVGNTVAWARGDGYPPFWAGRSREQPNHHGHGGIAFENQARQVLQHNNEFTSCRIGWDYEIQSGIEWGVPKGSAHHQALRLFNPVISETSSAAGNDSDTTGEAQAQIPDLMGCFGCDFDIFFRVDHRVQVLRGDPTAMLAQGWIGYGGNVMFNFDNYTYMYFFRDFAFFGATGGSAAFLGTRTSTFGFKNSIVEGCSNLSSPGGQGNWGPGWIDNVRDTGTAFGDKITQLYTSESQMPVTTPSWTLKTGVDGFNVTLNANNPFAQISFTGTQVDGYSPNGRHWPYFREETGAEPSDTNTGYAGVFEFKGDVKRHIERNGVFQSGGTWYCPCYFTQVDWRTFKHFTFRLDLALTGPWDTAFLTANTVTPTPPTFPLPPEDINKPFPAISPPTNSSAPFIYGPRIVGQKLQCNPGVWSGKPNDVDWFSFSWFRNGTTAIGSNGRTYVVDAADAGQPITCQVKAYNSGGASATLTTSAVTPHALTASTPDAIFGSSLKDVWTGEDPNSTQGDPPGPFSPGILVKSKDLMVHWAGAKLMTSIATFNSPGVIRRFGWLVDKSKCLDISDDAYTGAQHPRYWASNIVPNDGATGFHVWVVVQRSTSNQAGSGPIVKAAGFDTYLDSTGADPAQNQLFMNAGGANRSITTSFPKGGAGVLYHGRDAGASYGGFNGVVTQVATTGYTGSDRDFNIGYNSNVSFQVKAIYWVQGSVTAQQHASMQAYLAQRYL